MERKAEGLEQCRVDERVDGADVPVEDVDGERCRLPAGLLRSVDGDGR
jgi:hypothetical protein